jgi:hypothetical protein
LGKELFVTAGVFLKFFRTSFGIKFKFKSVIFCKTINVRSVILVAISLQFVSTDNKAKIQK